MTTDGGNDENYDQYASLQIIRNNLICSLLYAKPVDLRKRQLLLSTVELIEEVDKQYPQYRGIFSAKYEEICKKVEITVNEGSPIYYLDKPFHLSL